jgi:hypothetical protein
VSKRDGRIAFVLVAALALAGLLAAAATDQRSIAFSLDVPDAAAVVALDAGQSACQAPVKAASAFAGIRAWTRPDTAPGTALEVSVRDVGSGRLLASGRLAARFGAPPEHSAGLGVTVPPGRQIAVCLRNSGQGRVSLLGSSPGPASGSITVEGKPTQAAVSLVFLRARPRSLLSLFPTVFERAALFHPAWVGAWTFWGLVVALLGAVALSAVAVAQAARADAGNGDRTDGPCDSDNRRR